ncbi:hypothetical protein A3712_09305 [Vibrio sp. HI00D65]|uniref:LysR family transcriptional regulator n=1 Tax=Vibrio sp. HI00D65 TaxID=1822216 RepID=UPI0007B9A244|nr:LysR family transcriptional regulator [Vibrio sp. HI00D65]KZX69952.1 hypothetical protein A3712_09305 [Vibrio sp. HI00D65]
MLSNEKINIIIDIVKTSSFSQAARLNRISVSAVSQAIDYLEADIGFSVFERKPGKKPILTKNGHNLYLHCLAVNEKLNNLNEFLSYKGSEPESLVIYIDEWIASQSITSKILEVVTSNFDGNISIVNSYDKDLVDIYVGLGELDSHKMSSDKVISVICWKLVFFQSHCLTTVKDEKKIENLSEHQQIVIKRSKFHSDEVENSIMYSPNLIICSTLQQLQCLLEQGKGYAILPDIVIDSIPSVKKNAIHFDLESSDKSMFWPMIVRCKSTPSLKIKSIIDNINTYDF